MNMSALYWAAVIFLFGMILFCLVFNDLKFYIYTSLIRKILSILNLATPAYLVFKTDILVCKEGWVGIVRSVKARLTLR